MKTTYKKWRMRNVDLLNKMKLFLPNNCLGLVVKGVLHVEYCRYLGLALLKVLSPFTYPLYWQTKFSKGVVLSLRLVVISKFFGHYKSEKIH